MPKLPQKPIGERWIGIANLILTALIGIGAALYLKNRDESLAISLAQRNEEFQKQVISLQSEIQRKSSLAHLELVPVCPNPFRCSGAIEIRNAGPSSAKKVRIVANIRFTSDLWQDEINDISQFTFATTNPALEFKIQQIKVNPLYAQQMTGNNAFEFLLDTFPPNTQTRLVFDVDKSITRIATVTRTTTISFPTPPDPWYFFLDKPLVRYLEQKFKVADFTINASCENSDCYISEARFFISTLNTWGYKPANVHEDSQNTIATVEMYTNYLTPITAHHVPDMTSLYLKMSETKPPDEPLFYETHL